MDAQDHLREVHLSCLHTCLSLPMIACMSSPRRINGLAVREIRVRSGVSLTRAAADIGVTTGYLSKIENGKQQPSPQVALAIAARLKVSLDAISHVVEVAA